MLIKFSVAVIFCHEGYEICRASFETPPTSGIIKDADNIYYCTKNQVRGLCVGGDMAILP